MPIIDPSVYSYIFIFVVAIIFFYIIARMVNKRMEQNGSTASTTPPYDDETGAAQLSQLTKIQNTLGSGIRNARFDVNKNNSLRNFVIKSSFNSAYTGGFMNMNMVKYVLSRGCRFLDFEVYIKDNVPIVAYSESATDASYTHFTSSPPSLSFQGVLSTVMSNAFSDTSPNPNDPLFLQLRIRTKLPGGYNAIAAIIKNTMNDRLYSGIVTPDTQITDLLKKIVLIVDNTSAPDYQNDTVCDLETQCVKLSDLVNIDSGTSVVRIYSEKDLALQAYNPPDPSVYMMRIVLPGRSFLFGIHNSNFLSLMKNYGAQIVAQAFYINDSRLTAYEDMFRQFQSAIVPIPLVLKF
jgi:Phosphatidylinositol-specific phospholipase C, X domain